FAGGPAAELAVLPVRRPGQSIQVERVTRAVPPPPEGSGRFEPTVMLAAWHERHPDASGDWLHAWDASEGRLVSCTLPRAPTLKPAASADGRRTVFFPANEVDSVSTVGPLVLFEIDPGGDPVDRCQLLAP